MSFADAGKVRFGRKSEVQSSSEVSSTAGCPRKVLRSLALLKSVKHTSGYLVCPSPLPLGLVRCEKRSRRAAKMRRRRLSIIADCWQVFPSLLAAVCRHKGSTSDLPVMHLARPSRGHAVKGRQFHLKGEAIQSQRPNSRPGLRALTAVM